MSYEFKLPDIGEGVVEGEIVAWLVAEGDTVGEDQPIVEVLTDKATVTIPSPKAGKVTSLPWKVGDSVPVGKTLIVLDIGGGAATAAKAPAEKTPAPAAKTAAPAKAAASPTPATPAPKKANPEPAERTLAEAPAKADVGELAAEAADADEADADEEAIPEEENTPEEEAPEPAAEAETEAADDEEGVFEGHPGGRVLAAPASRRLARELGVDIQSVRPSGKFGRVTREDIERAAQGPKSREAAKPPAPTPPKPAQGAPGGAAPSTYVKPAPMPVSAAPDAERLKLKGIRKAQAEGMVRSFYSAPHFTYVEEIDVTDLIAVRARLKEPAKAKGTELTFLPLIIKAVVTMLKEHKFLNAALDEAAQEIVFHRTYHIGIAVATDHGLTVPVIHEADKKGLLEIAAELADKSERARKLKLTKDDFGGSTFTITSLGKIGGILATPILNPGEVAILGIHNMRTTAKWDKETKTFVPRETMNVSLSFDHRVVDGFTGAGAVQRLRELLESPELLLLEMR